MTELESGLRADAQANRERILAAAREAFAASQDASLNSIAKAAGVGAGTLYRHFPGREALILALYRSEIEALVDLAPALVDAHPPLDAFRLWCARLADYGRIKYGLAEVIHATLTDRDRQETYWPMVGAVGRLLKACEASGDFRLGANPEDILLLLGFLWRIKPGHEGAAQAERLLSVVIDGLREPRA
jgi:AcrR family transcriptional regulator